MRRELLFKKQKQERKLKKYLQKKYEIILQKIIQFQFCKQV